MPATALKKKDEELLIQYCLSQDNYIIIIMLTLYYNTEYFTVLELFNTCREISILYREACNY